MSVLCAGSIEHYCSFMQLVDPWCHQTVHNGMTYGIGPCGYDIRITKLPQQRFMLKRGDFILAASVERIKMPNNIMGVVHDKSTWARRGLALQNTVLEPGWEGYITLELSMHGHDQLTITDGDPVAQIVFHQLYAPTSLPYRGKYQNQPQEPVAAIMVRDVE